MRYLTACLLNLNEALLTIDVLNKLASLSSEEWSIQLILVDNGSNSDQVRLLSDWFLTNKDQFTETQFITSSSNLGANGGRNYALELASCNRILILDNDVILPDDFSWLAALWRHLEVDPLIGIVGPMLVFADYPNIVQGAGIGLTDQGRVGYLNRADLVEHVPSTPIQVAASPASCWLMLREAQQSVGLFSDEFYPMQYWDVDFCVRLTQAGWKILCDRSVRIKHIENMTTRHLKEYPYARVAVRHWMLFRQKWAEVLPKIATIDEDDIYWGPIPRHEN